MTAPAKIEFGFLSAHGLSDSAADAVMDELVRRDFEAHALTKELERVKKEAADAVRERDACHQCWDDFTEKVCTVLPDMKHAPLFSQADAIVAKINQLSDALVRIMQSGGGDMGPTMESQIAEAALGLVSDGALTHGPCVEGAETAAKE